MIKGFQASQRGDDEGSDDENLASGGTPTLPKEKPFKDPFQGFNEETDVILPQEQTKPHDKDREEGFVKIGEKSFLGDGHTGSPRHLSKLAMNALTIVSELGKPTFFLTLTCNQMWPEVQCRLFPGQSAFDREDIINQVI
jgi:Helitron helicase-like domain at N-terminus